MNSALAEITIQAKAEHEAALAKIQEIQKEEQWRQVEEGAHVRQVRRRHRVYHRVRAARVHRDIRGLPAIGPFHAAR